MGVALRKGTKYACSVGEPVQEIKISNGRIAAKIGEMWRIIPNPPLLKPT